MGLRKSRSWQNKRFGFRTTLLASIVVIGGCASNSPPPPPPSSSSSSPPSSPSSPSQSPPSQSPPSQSPPSQSPPSQSPPSQSPPSQSPPSQSSSSPPGAPGSPSQSSSQNPPDSSSPPGGSEGSSEQPPGGQPQEQSSSSDGDSELPGSESQPTWEEQEAGGGAQGDADAQAQAQAQAGGGGQPPGDDADSWESGLPSESGDGWETSNQVPGEGNSQVPPMPSEQGLPPGQGGDEATAGADGELNEALEAFDGEILAERAVIQARSNETAGTGTSANPSGLPSAADIESSSDLPKGNPAYVPRGIPTASNSQKGPPMGGASGQVPEDIPDARDDDIIARQLREAAMNEVDPDLREKLWEEYRRYTGA